ncbi:vesicle-associated membrane protein/synaptobrevin-binding protein isoform X1 [Calliphora vicina]|uniref:vesicle-associated membrane protein/synaptobrevin-binding protein isoform X1 n=1 Tax=Calliphora vicina TaxID=7373 RepID=UPI00325AD467
MALLTEAQLRAKLIIDPPGELRFIGPFTSPVITTLKLTNPSDETILFKIKTTAPKRYCVRPNFGWVAPNDNVSVEICLQPFNFDPFEKNKHKFMVQSIVSPSSERPQDPNKYWKELPPEHFMDAKLKCVFEMPEGHREETATAVKAVKTEASLPLKVKNEEKVNILNLDNSDQIEWQTNELRQLREENSNLRKELLKIKEEIIRNRSSPSKPPMGEPYTPVMVGNQFPMFYIAIAIAAIIFGIIFGKFVL